MPVAGDTFSFTKANVDGAPDKPGVYALLRNVNDEYPFKIAVTSQRS
jgi:hypothetical protein